MNVINGSAIPKKTGTVRLNGFSPNKSYHVQWWDTHKGVALRAQSLAANSQGILTLSVESLTSDIAVKIE